MEVAASNDTPCTAEALFGPAKITPLAVVEATTRPRAAAPAVGTVMRARTRSIHDDETLCLRDADCHGTGSGTCAGAEPTAANSTVSQGRPWVASARSFASRSKRSCRRDGRVAVGSDNPASPWCDMKNQYVGQPADSLKNNGLITKLLPLSTPRARRSL